MTKMNRRDYLVRMGLAAGAAASLPTLDVLGKLDLPECSATAGSESGQAPASLGLLRWVPTHVPPSPDAFVTAIFWGLMGLCYKTPVARPPACEVAMHPGGNHHEFSVRVVKITGSSPTLICVERPSRITNMKLKVIGGGEPPKVYEANRPFNRATTDDERDFRWLPELEDVDFYPEPYDKNKHFGARLNVENGVFYTRMRTNSKFKLVRAENHLSEIREFGHVARFMAAAIEVRNASDYVSFEMNGVAPCLLRQERDVKYQIIFKNECSHSSCPGPSTIDDPDERNRNHFHFMRKVLKIPGGRIKYALKIRPPASSASPLNFYDPDADARAMVTDEAPCAGAAFGQTNGFPT